jgi:hypothetical protein
MCVDAVSLAILPDNVGRDAQGVGDLVVSVIDVCGRQKPIIGAGAVSGRAKDLSNALMGDAKMGRNFWIGISLPSHCCHSDVPGGLFVCLWHRYLHANYNTNARDCKHCGQPALTVDNNCVTIGA